MKEEFLYYIWQFQLFSSQKLRTLDNESLQIIEKGKRNLFGGPDFLYAKIQIGTTVWAGHVEMHLKTSDWLMHKHQEDTNYDNVILHIVFHHDTVQGMRKDIPILSLANYIEPQMINRYRNLGVPHVFIPCENLMNTLKRDDSIGHFFKQLTERRLERKSEQIKQQLEKNKFNWELTLFRMMAQYMGAHQNKVAMEMMLEHIPDNVLLQCFRHKDQLNALLFGQAGFLLGEAQDDYQKKLQTQYTYLQHKYNLSSPLRNPFQFYGVRPANYPTLRLAQLVAIYGQYSHAFSWLKGIDDVEKVYAFFEVEVTDYWRKHYHFNKESKREIASKFTRPFVNTLIINVVFSLKYVYYQAHGVDRSREINMQMIKMSAEKNSIIDRFKILGVTASNALESQALIELKNNYCDEKKCLSCSLGIQLIKT